MACCTRHCCRNVSNLDGPLLLREGGVAWCVCFLRLRIGCVM